MQKDDVIYRQAAIDEWKNDFKGYINALNMPKDDYNGIMEYINELPSDQPERKRGKWNVTDAYPHNVYCSECHKRFAQTHWAVWEDGSLPRNFCPNCGADMRGEQDETD